MLGDEVRFHVGSCGCDAALAIIQFSNEGPTFAARVREVEVTR